MKYLDGATPLDPDELYGLNLSFLTLQRGNAACDAPASRNAGAFKDDTTLERELLING